MRVSPTSIRSSPDSLYSMGEIDLEIVAQVAPASTPLLKDLYEYVTPQYAVDWKVIGASLGLPAEALRIIEHDNTHPCNRYNVKACCNAMLEQWLEVDSAASWEKIDKAVKSRAVSSNGNHSLGMCVSSVSVSHGCVCYT